jgi:hypothetical protein
MWTPAGWAAIRGCIMERFENPESAGDAVMDQDEPVSGGLMSKLLEVNKELWLILGILSIAGAMNYLVTAKRMVIGFYTMPTLFSAYYFGRRHAVFTAFASVFLVGLLAYVNPLIFVDSGTAYNGEYDIIVWGGILVVTAYAMGTLHEREKIRIEELRQTYQGVIIMLKQLVCKDKASENHAYRVSVYATKIAEYRGLSVERIEDVRAAALLHDIGNLEASRDLLYRAAQLTGQSGEPGSKSVRGPIHRIVPIILTHRNSFDSPAPAADGHIEIPLEARILKVADAYDSLTTDHPSRKAVTPLEAKNIMAKEAGTEFDPTVIHAFKRAFRKGEMEKPELVEAEQGL